jgi:hypothetical protein
VPSAHAPTVRAAARMDASERPDVARRAGDDDMGSEGRSERAGGEGVASPADA